VVDIIQEERTRDERREGGGGKGNKSGKGWDWDVFMFCPASVVGEAVAGLAST
jgi:hypothetical protein